MRLQLSSICSVAGGQYFAVLEIVENSIRTTPIFVDFPLPNLVISIEVINDYIIPGLRAVKQDIEALAPDCEVATSHISPPEKKKKESDVFLLGCP